MFRQGRARFVGCLTVSLTATLALLIAPILAISLLPDTSYGDLCRDERVSLPGIALVASGAELYGEAAQQAQPPPTIFMPPTPFRLPPTPFIPPTIFVVPTPFRLPPTAFIPPTPFRLPPTPYIPPTIFVAPTPFRLPPTPFIAPTPFRVPDWQNVLEQQRRWQEQQRILEDIQRWQEQQRLLENIQRQQEQQRILEDIQRWQEQQRLLENIQQQQEQQRILEDIQRWQEQQRLLDNLQRQREVQNALSMLEGQQSLTIGSEEVAEQLSGFDLNVRGIESWHNGQTDVALDAFEAALTIAQETGGSQLRALSLANLGALYPAQPGSNSADVLDYYARALEIQQQVDDLAGEARTNLRIGQTHEQAQEIDRALEAYHVAFSAARQAENWPEEAESLYRIGDIHMAEEAFADAVDYYSQALGIYQQMALVSGEALALLRLSQANLALDNYAQAHLYLSQALRLLEGTGGQPISLRLEAEILRTAGTAQRLQGQYFEAMSNYIQALDIYISLEDRGNEATTLNYMGVVYYWNGQYEKALEYYTRALQMMRDMGEGQNVGAILTNIGTTYLALQQYDQALSFFEDAIPFIQESGNRFDEISVLYNTGVAFDSQNKDTLALHCFNQALAAARDNGYRAGQISILVSRGRVYEALNQPDQAIEDYMTAVEVIETLFGDAALDSAITSLVSLEHHRWPYQRLSVLLTRRGDLADALHYAERGRALLTRTQLTSGTINFRENVDESFLERETALRHTLQLAQQYLDSLLLDPISTSTALVDAQQGLDQARRQYQEHIEIMQLEGGFLAREIAYDVASLEQIQAALPLDTTLVIYSIGSIAGADNGVAFLVTADSISAIVLNVTPDTIDDKVRAFMGDRRVNTAVLAELYDLIFSPLPDHIRTSRLLIVPDSLLNYVPFAALQAPDGSYLIEHYAISMVASGTTVALLHEREASQLQPTSPALVLAQASGSNQPQLQHVRTEAMRIAELYGVEAHLAATEDDLRASVVGSEVLHISAHAQLDPLAPMFSAIYLAESENHDGRLEVREIYELDLTRGTELVVLSGCETATGGSGDDFGLLTKAFLAAGAQEVIASLWRVEEEATVELLSNFYAVRANFDHDADALQAAMLDTRRSHPEPYYWASFTLSGLPVLH